MFYLTVGYASCGFTPAPSVLLFCCINLADVVPQSFDDSSVLSPLWSALPLEHCMCCLVPSKQKFALATTEFTE